MKVASLYYLMDHWQYSKLRVLTTLKIFLGISVEKRKKNGASLHERRISGGYSWKSQGTYRHQPFSTQRNCPGGEHLSSSQPKNTMEFPASQKKGDLKRTSPLVKCPLSPFVKRPPIWGAIVIFVSVTWYYWENFIFICEFSIFVAQFGYSVELLRVKEDVD